MITESGRVVAIEDDSLWVETIQRSVCGSCAAEKGCGQSLLARVTGSTTHIRVLLGQRRADEFAIGDTVQIGIPEDVIAKGALLVYSLPLLGLVGGAVIAEALGLGEAGSIAGGLLGTLAGGAAVRWHSYLRRHDRHSQPVLVDPIPLAQQAQQHQPPLA